MIWNPRDRSLTSNQRCFKLADGRKLNFRAPSFCAHPWLRPWRYVPDAGITNGSGDARPFFLSLASMPQALCLILECTGYGTFEHSPSFSRTGFFCASCIFPGIASYITHLLSKLSLSTPIASFLKPSSFTFPGLASQYLSCSCSGVSIDSILLSPPSCSHQAISLQACLSWCCLSIAAYPCRPARN